MINRSFMVDRDLWMKVREEAHKRNFSISAIIRALLTMWIDGKVDIQI